MNARKSRYVLTSLQQFSSSEATKLQAQAKEVDALRVDGKFVTASGEVPASNDEVGELLSKCLRWSEIVLERYVCQSKL